MKTRLNETNSMRKLMGLPLLNESSITFPITLKGQYSANNCDELHAFQSTNGRTIGNMNVIVGDKLKELYQKGYNIKVTNVDVSVSNMTVKWVVTIDKSEDGEVWIGFTSRGAGCNSDIENRSTSTQSGNDVGTLKKRIVSAGLNGDNDFKIEKINDYTYSGGDNSFKQVFYRYTRPIDYPTKKIVGGDTEIVDDEDRNLPQF